MITITCPSCAHEMSISEDMIGVRGKCPKCKCIFNAHAPESADFIPLDENSFFTDPHLSKMYADYLQTHAEAIVSQKLIRSNGDFPVAQSDEAYADVLFLTLRFNDSRTQEVSIFALSGNIGNFDGNKKTYLLFHSSIGVLKDGQELVHALLDEGDLDFASIRLSKDAKIYVFYACLLSGLTSQDFAFYVDCIASKADRLEKELFGTDDK